MSASYKILTLAEIENGKSCIIVKVNGYGAFRHRIMEMGFIKGQIVKVVKNAPFRDPIEYDVMHSHVSLRRNEAAMIEVVEADFDTTVSDTSYYGTISFDCVNKIVSMKTKDLTVALVGNPNSGKTSLFNRLTGGHERVGNYGGVTIDAKTSELKYQDYTIRFVDLPGTYSITDYTPEEVYVRTFIAEQHPDIILNVVDASNLERNLFLTTQLIDMNQKMVVALNMYDELQKSEAELDYDQLGKLLGFPFVPTVARKGSGIEKLLDTIIQLFENDELTRHIHINYGQEIEHAIQAIKTEIAKDSKLNTEYPARYLAIRMLENDRLTQQLVDHSACFDQIKQVSQKQIKLLEKEFKEDPRSLITDAKYGFIKGALKETLKPATKEKHKKSDAIDDVLTNPVFGVPILLGFLWLMFQTTFTLGSYPMDWIESGVTLLSHFVSQSMPESWFKDLIVDGVIAGVGGVIVFLPNILILFFFISLMEDTGYMARTAFIMDRLMHKIGLHGKSFIPMLIGFGCNVPAIMATRTLESRKDRMLTMLIIPLMSCSARLPVYILLISAFFPHYQGLILLSVYIIGIILAILVAFLFKSTLFAKLSNPFVMELPPYRRPTMRNTVIHMWDKGSQYLRKMGGIILIAAVIIWFLGYFPRQKKSQEVYQAKIETIKEDISLDDNSKEIQIKETEEKAQSDHLEHSFIGQLGHGVEPLIQPLGFDWKMGVSIITGLGAKELVVSTMGVLYQADPEAEDNGLVQKIQEQTYTSGHKIGEKVFTPLTAYAFMLFILIYFPCMATIAAIKKEGGLKWAIFTMCYTTLLAWLVSFGVYQIGSLFLH